jgi:hypothetical protein
MTPEIENIGGRIAVVRAAANTAVTAGGGGDNTAVTGVIIDRAAFGWPQSAVFAIPFTTTLAATQSLAINSCVVQSGENSGLSDATTLATRPNGNVATSSGGGTVTGVVEFDVNLSGAGRYVRFNYTPDLSASGTDTAALGSAVAVFGGAIRLPA